jgi:outer membrane protein OmpA-like peptidoglycan-associated protein
VGYDGNSKPLVLSGDPSSWTASNATEVNVGSSFGSYVELQAVSCSSATTCTAVAGDGHNQPFLISGDPSSWSASDASQVSLGSSFGSNGYLDGVSCTGATACIAVASDGNSEPLVLTGSAVIVLAPPVAYNVTYSLGGGTGTVPALRSGTAGTAFALPSGSLLSRVGYTFAGWSDGTSTYRSGASYAIGSSAVTLTAQWAADSIKSKVHPSCVVHFSNNSTQLTSTSRMILTKFATSLKSKGIASITIVGFADATGSSATNQALSLHRAQSVATSLRMEFKAVGLDSEKIRVVGGGVSTTSGTQGRNRKVVVSS